MEYDGSQTEYKEYLVVGVMIKVHMARTKKPHSRHQRLFLISKKIRNWKSKSRISN